MNRSTLRKIFGDLWTRKGRTALVSISIFIGVLGVVTLITAGDLLVKQLREDVKEAELPMLQVFMTVPPNVTEVELDDNAYVSDLQQAFPEITAIEGTANNPFYWKFKDEGRFREARMVVYLGPLADKVLEPMRLVRGEYPQPGQRQVVVEQRMAEDYDLDVGDVIDLRMLGLEGLPTQSWTVSGIVFHAYNQASDRSMYTLYEDAQAITGIEGLNILAMRFTDFETAQASLELVQASINEDTPYAAMIAFPSDPAHNQAIESTEQFTSILTALAVVAMLVSGFLVLNVVNNLVVEQQRQIGVIKSLGATRGETFIIYGGVAVTYGVLGMVPGVLAGMPLGYQMAVIIGDFANTLIDSFAVSSLAVSLGVFLGLAVPIGSAIIPVYAGTRITILQAMTDLGIGGGYNVGFLNRIIRKLPLPLNIKQSFNNLTQKKARLALTAITLTLAVTAFMGVTAVFVRINDVLQKMLDTFQYQIVFQTTESQELETVEALLMGNVTGVQEVYPGSFGVAQVEGYVGEQSGTSQVMLQGVVPEIVEYQYLVAGTAWMENSERDGIVLTNEITDQLGKNVGDTVTINVSGQRHKLEIIGILNFPMPMGQMRWQELARLTGFTLGAPPPNRYFTGVQVDGYSGTLPDGQITAWGIDGQVIPFLTLDEGTPITPGKPGVVISELAARNGGYNVGDQVTVTTAEGAAAVPILGIFAPPAQLAEYQIPSDLMVFFWEDLANLEGLSLEGTPVPNAFFVLAQASDPDAREVDGLIEEINDMLVDNGITASYINITEIADLASKAILSVGIVLNIASGVMAAVGAIGLIATLSIAVYERQKEIGIMRSVGAKSPTIVVQFLVEGVLIGVIAWVIAVPLSVALAWGLTEILPFGDFIAFVYPPIMLPLGFVGILIVATISSVWPSVSAARKTVANILRYQ
jgi:putative ABC transport system permease protein